MFRFLSVLPKFALLVLVALSANADELVSAYQKEYAYLVAEREALQQRLASLKTSQEETLGAVSTEIEALQRTYLSKKNSVDRKNVEISDASRDVDFSENDRLVLETTLIQAEGALEKLGLKFDVSKELDEQLAAAFESASLTMKNDGLIQRKSATYFDVLGAEHEGEVLEVGRIARYAIDATAAGALAPTGGGKFKIWDEASKESSIALALESDPKTISVFLFDNVEVGIEKSVEKGFEDDVKAGGLIGKIILVVGAIGALLVLIRVIFLMSLGASTEKVTKEVSQVLRDQGPEAALKASKEKSGSAGRVISATLRNIKKERDHIEDIISEAILYESSKIDRFGSAILVIAAVAPLMGLLGTVTGMIGTFDIITEFGTGDPKLLSTGISEALVTTKFGLIVAIPLLLVGNMLSSWALRTKAGIERGALKVITTHKEMMS